MLQRRAIQASRAVKVSVKRALEGTRCSARKELQCVYFVKKHTQSYIAYYK